jgi:hypothetical protein
MFDDRIQCGPRGYPEERLVVSDNRARLFSSDISWLEGIKDF